MPWRDLFSFTPKPKPERERRPGEPREKPRMGFRLDDEEIVARFQKRWRMVHEIAPNYDAFCELRPEFQETTRRLAQAWKFYRSPGFSLRNRHHEESLIQTLSDVHTELLWFRYMALRDEDSRANWAAAKEWVWADNAEYEAELMKTLSMSAPRRRNEPLSHWIARLRKIRAALAQVPAA